jgi:hypothetical protein
VQWVKYTARGFRNEENFVNAIYFHCGGLDLANALQSSTTPPARAYFGADDPIG